MHIHVHTCPYARVCTCTVFVVWFLTHVEPGTILPTEWAEGCAAVAPVGVAEPLSQSRRPPHGEPLLHRQSLSGSPQNLHKVCVYLYMSSMLCFALSYMYIHNT